MAIPMLVATVVTSITVGLPGASWADDSSFKTLKTTSNPDWMSKVPDERGLGDMSIPGTHETMAIHGGPLVQTQQNFGDSGGTLAAQLDAGIRMIDIRVRRSEGDTFTIHHGAVYQKANFDDVLDTLGGFLNIHTRETIIMRLKQECTGKFASCKDADGVKSFEDIFDKYRDNNGSAKSHFWRPSTDRTASAPTPRIGAVRGKIVLAVLNDKNGGRTSQYGLSQFADWNDGNSTYVQDNYNVPTLGAIATKRDQVRRFLDKTSDSSGGHLHVNFTSGASAFAYPDAVAGGTVVPRQAGVNPFLLEYLNQGTDVHPAIRRTGAIMMDFPGGGLIDKIISMNNFKDSGESGLRERNLRVMPLGDSITTGVQGVGGGGYRGALYAQVQKEAKSVDFVGSMRSGNIPDPDHEGHNGWTIEEIAGVAACSVESTRPNVVLLHAGTNDMNENLDLAGAPQRLSALIKQVADDAPEAVILVATLIPTGKAGLQPRIDAFNAALPGLVKQHRDAGRKVRLTPMDKAVQVTDGLQGDAHPNDAGYIKMAAMWYVAIQQAAAEISADPRPGSNKNCANAGGGQGTGGTALGPGWRAIGVIAPGMGGAAAHIDLVDINGDKRADYVKVFPNGSVQAALNTPGTPGFPHWVDQGIIVPGVGQPDRTVRWADMNGDGRDDYLIVGERGSVRAYLNTPGASGKPKWVDWGVVVPGVDAPREAVRFADVDGNGRDDYLVVGERGSINAYLNTPGDGGKPKWVLRKTWAGGVQGGSREQLRMADVNGDGKADYLIVGSTGAVHAYINNGGGGNGGFTKRLNFANVSNYPGNLVTFRDFSGDGKADYVVVYQQGAIRGWLNQGGNTTG